MNTPRFARLSALTLVALAAILACDGNGLTGTRLSAGARSDAKTDGRRDRALSPRAEGAASGWRLASCGEHVSAAGSGVFGPSGGTLTVGMSELVILPGALRDTVTISGVTRDDSTSAVDFYPQGLRFARPASLRLASEGCPIPDEIAPDVVYIDENGMVLETIPAVFDRVKHVVAAPIEHFSGYAIAF